VRVGGQEFSDEILRRIGQTVADEPQLSRRGLSQRVCQWLDWRSANGQLKQMSARVALLKLQRQGIIVLPECRSAPPRRAEPAEEPQPMESPEPLECGLAQLQPVEVVLVGRAGSCSSQQWNQLMERYHRLGAGPLCGAQLRYLIRSRQQQWLGGLAFSAAAWQLAARDEWIGWSPAARQQNLQRVVGNSRFLIVPAVRVPHLASHVLGLVLRRLAADWQQRYGYEPWLVETFVERPRYAGTSYRASNWVAVGTTQGRGRQDRQGECGLSRKDIYLYPLKPQARRRLGEASIPPPATEVAADPSDWATQEFGGVRLGDRRLQRRAVTLARDFGARPQAQIPQACQTRAKTKAAYRFFDHPATDMNSLLASHYQATTQRVQQQRLVLAVQDTTSLNYSAHPATEGLGPIGSKLNGGPVGLLVHDTLAFTVEGTPLGLLDLQCWARDGDSFGKKHRRGQRAIEDKESHKWLQSFQRVAQVQKRCPRTQLVSVADREADIYELFHLARPQPGDPQLLIRAEHDRLLAEGQGHLLGTLRRQPLAGGYALRVPRRGQRPARQAQMQVRFAPVTLQPPSGKTGLGPLSLWAVLAEEVEAPSEVEPVRWLLLTTCRVESFPQALEKLRWYCIRWWIEVYHRTLKSGCRIEERQLGTADRIEACLAIDLVVAWRVFYLAKLGRETPELPCTVFFEEAEWKALTMFVQRTPAPPARPANPQQALGMVASLGGHLGRKSDGPPGTKSLWLGLQRLDDIQAVWLFMANQFAPQLLGPANSRAPT